MVNEHQSGFSAANPTAEAASPIAALTLPRNAAEGHRVRRRAQQHIRRDLCRSM